MLHKDKTGKLTPIASLEDSHLVNIIKYHFKAYVKEEDNELLSFLAGKSLPKMTPEKFYEILHDRSFYIIEGLRRDTIREQVISFLGQFNPIFKTKESVVVPQTNTNYLLDGPESLSDYDYGFSDFN